MVCILIPDKEKPRGLARDSRLYLKWQILVVAFKKL